jgi:hypothetical protein
MKMKKIFKLLLCAAIVAAGFTACSEEVTPIDGSGPVNSNGGTVEEGTPTHATFSINVPGAATKGLAPDASENTTIDNFRVLIFDNATGKLEVDTARAVASGDTIITIQLISGTKRIYVFANGGATAKSLSTPAKGVSPLTYTDGNVSHINDTTHLTSLTSFPYADLDSLHMLYANGKFYYSNVVANTVFTLEPSITAPDSKDATSKNRLYIELERPVAKVAVRQSASNSDFATVDGKGNIVANTIKYTVWGVNTRMFPFQRSAAGAIVTPEYLPTATTDPLTTKFYARNQGSGGSSNAFISISYSTTATGHGASSGNRYYYVSENNPSTKKKGNTTIANVEAVYLPKAGTYITSPLTYNNVSKVYTTITPGAADQASAQDMYLLKGAFNGLVDGVLFAGSDALLLAKKVYYHIKYPDAADQALAQYATLVDLSAVQADFDIYFNKYTAGKAYYRLDIGQQTGTGTNAVIDNTIKRNFYYDCDITGFLKLGENVPTALVEPENEDLKGLTNLSVTITIRDWEGLSIHTPI